jgi:hypothetical protein
MTVGSVSVTLVRHTFAVPYSRSQDFTSVGDQKNVVMGPWGQPWRTYTDRAQALWGLRPLVVGPSPSGPKAGYGPVGYGLRLGNVVAYSMVLPGWLPLQRLL